MEELRKKASAMIKVIDEHETREKQMSSVERMEKFKITMNKFFKQLLLRKIFGLITHIVVNPRGLL